MSSLFSTTKRRVWKNNPWSCRNFSLWKIMDSPWYEGITRLRVDKVFYLFCAQRLRRESVPHKLDTKLPGWICNPSICYSDPHGNLKLCFQHLRFYNGIMVTCSKDRSIAVWDMVSPTEINLRRVLGKIGRFILDSILLPYPFNKIVLQLCLRQDLKDN